MNPKQAWWDKYEKANELEKYQMVSQLSTIKTTLKVRNDQQITEEVYKNVLIIGIQSLFDDCIEVMNKRWKR